jgi:hypothetical protein
MPFGYFLLFLIIMSPWRRFPPSFCVFSFSADVSFTLVFARLFIADNDDRYNKCYKMTTVSTSVTHHLVKTNVLVLPAMPKRLLNLQQAMAVEDRYRFKVNPELQPIVGMK